MSGDLYLVWSNEHGGWWRPGHQGYTGRMSQAGVYDREAALAICARAIPGKRRGDPLPELPVRFADAQQVLKQFHEAHPGLDPEPAPEPMVPRRSV